MSLLRLRIIRSAFALRDSAQSCQLLESAMQNYINHENVRRYQRLIAIGEPATSRDGTRHQTLFAETVERGFAAVDELR
ncbi:hypothetical protein HAP47_0016475 [Bradyrhizobium sp. 41S5]|uniref:hypothetical protein n=1 Tax=Bradyrhizobium sp. 41S5 TaxID=1404443 RepID=UPI00156B4639|nr:hypothetical protein [Bradyrhizobium sp. 41S5]UFX48167.1 hypothetical protein HAP47_0016475 [Bradyrhizobium sp. 41S5]